jgi:hypothetical protein
LPVTHRGAPTKAKPAFEARRDAAPGERLRLFADGKQMLREYAFFMELFDFTADGVEQLEAVLADWRAGKRVIGEDGAFLRGLWPEWFR